MPIKSKTSSSLLGQRNQNANTRFLRPSISPPTVEAKQGPFRLCLASTNQRGRFASVWLPPTRGAVSPLFGFHQPEGPFRLCLASTNQRGRFASVWLIRPVRIKSPLPLVAHFGTSPGAHHGTHLIRGYTSIFLRKWPRRFRMVTCSCLPLAAVR